MRWRGAFSDCPFLTISFFDSEINGVIILIIVSSYDKGVGIKFTENKNTDYGWSDFFDIVKQRGYKPITRRV